jgi:hypothetical protein
MIKTLRITVLLTAIVAVVFFVLSAVFGMRHDTGKEAFLANPGVTAVFKKGAAITPNAEADSPLVTQAQALALRINPPPPQVDIRVEAVKVVETPKFRLLGTSFYPDDPNRSVALIDEPGKGMHWIAVSDKVGYLTITQIADGKVVYTDGQKSMDMMVERPQAAQQISVISIDGKSPPSTAQKPPVEQAAATPLQPETAAVGSPPPVDVPTTPEQIKDNVEFIKKLMTDPNSVGVNAAEANELKDLGEFLKQLEKEQTQAQAEVNRPVEEPNSKKAEPNSRHSE